MGRREALHPPAPSRARPAGVQPLRRALRRWGSALLRVAGGRVRPTSARPRPLSKVSPLHTGTSPPSSRRAATSSTSTRPTTRPTPATRRGGTGLVVTPPSASGAIDSATLHALQVGGVSKLHVVGGPDAVTPAELTTLRATPAYACGGTTHTSADIALLEGTLFEWPNKTLLVAQGTPSGWSDALSAAAQPGGGEEASLLTAGPGVALPSSLTSALVSAGSTASGLGDGQSTGIEVLGGPSAVTDAHASALQAALNGQ